MGKKKNRQYTSEFKQQAAELAIRIGIGRAAEQLGVCVGNVQRWSSGWNFFIPDDLKGDILPKNIVGFKIKIESINFKNKMSQNRSAADRVGILNGLESRADDNSQAVLEEMRKLYSSNGESNEYV